jgi:hypothetical protein
VLDERPHCSARKAIARGNSPMPSALRVKP